MIRRRIGVNRRSGVAAVELAVCLPLLLLMLVGVWEVGRFVEVQQLLSNAVREGGRQASTGNKSLTEVKDYVVTYLKTNGITTVSASDVTFQNLTDSSRTDPRDAEQMDRLRVSVSVPANDVRWVAMTRITQMTHLTASSDWRSMKDIPITVNSTIPVQ